MKKNVVWLAALSCASFSQSRKPLKTSLGRCNPGIPATMWARSSCRRSSNGFLERKSRKTRIRKTVLFFFGENFEPQNFSKTLSDLDAFTGSSSQSWTSRPHAQEGESFCLLFRVERKIVSGGTNIMYKNGQTRCKYVVRRVHSTTYSARFSKSINLCLISVFFVFFSVLCSQCSHTKSFLFHSAEWRKDRREEDAQ